MREYKASIGSISTGTLKTDDLIEAFSDELSSILGEQAADCKLLSECDAWLEAHADENNADDDEGSELAAELEDALNEHAPLYCYFGAVEGDGADIGFWPCREQIEELPRVENSDEAKALGEDACFVNDHGNVTVYGGDGSVILELV